MLLRQKSVEYAAPMLVEQHHKLLMGIGLLTDRHFPPALNRIQQLGTDYLSQSETVG